MSQIARKLNMKDASRYSQIRRSMLFDFNGGRYEYFGLLPDGRRESISEGDAIYIRLSCAVKIIEKEKYGCVL